DLAVGLPAAGDDRVRTMRRQQFGDPGADAAAGAGDDGDLAGEVEQVWRAHGGCPCRRVSDGWRAQRPWRSTRPASCGPVPKAPDQMIIDHPGRLQQRVTDGAADEAEAALPECLAHAIGELGAGRHLARSTPAIDHGVATDE